SFPTRRSSDLLSWSFIHTIFSIHYAHEYYGERSDGKIGGLNFPEDNEPDYLGFSLFLAGRRPDLASFRRRRHQQGHSPRGGAARRAVVLLQPDDIGADREHDLECHLVPARGDDDLLHALADQIQPRALHRRRDGRLRDGGKCTQRKRRSDLNRTVNAHGSSVPARRRPAPPRRRKRASTAPLAPDGRRRRRTEAPGKRK